ncbi:sugar kinase [Streptococcus pantholopis]|uniref:2-dehydro-3-deoxygluconokinase n=1 Tax=Streptococcus pantholopis TaxID=1811193 RepID=A0A172Q781_9STRE|nr:sugar kinase [Streptococcus pantholopis]AND79353.1 2-dehydro-3-deoxygluconokinase [Streptococcus pantholopis]
MAKLLLAGEPLIRICPDQCRPLSNACSSQVFFGGSEVNIARTISGFGGETRLLTALPDNPVGHAFNLFLRQSQIDTNLISWEGKRIGLYYLENGFGCRSSKVCYDRAGSSFTEMSLKNYDFDQIFEDITHFHFSGISLALGQSSQDLIEFLAVEAKKRKICVSFDLNFRSSIISKNAAKSLFSRFANYADIIFGIDPLMLNDSDLTMFDRDQADSSTIKKRLSGLYQRYCLQAIFHTVREKTLCSSNRFKAYAFDGQYQESVEISTPILQRVGSGDAFVAGALYQLMQGNDMVSCINFATAAASLKCTVADDQLYVSVQQVKDILKNKRDIQR